MTGGSSKNCWSTWLMMASTPGASCANSKLLVTGGRGVPAARAAHILHISLCQFMYCLSELDSFHAVHANSVQGSTSSRPSDLLIISGLGNGHSRQMKRGNHALSSPA